MHAEKHRYAKRLTNVVTIDGETVPIRLRERLRQQVRDLDKKEQEDKANGKTIWHEKINVPSGCLQLYVEGPLPAGVKGLFEDAASLTLEDQLGHVLKALARLAEHTMVLRAEREAERQRWEVQRRKQAAIEQRIRAEQKRIATFTALYTQWRQANDCRTFVEELVRAAAYQDCPDTQKARFERWANAVIDSIDPVINGAAHALISNEREESVIFDEAMRRYHDTIKTS